MADNFKTYPAFALLEVVLSSALIGIVSLALIAGLAPNFRQAGWQSSRQQAWDLAQEGLAVARFTYLQDPTSLPVGTYGLTRAGASWTLGPAPDVTGNLERSLEISDVPGVGRQAVVRLHGTNTYQPLDLSLEQIFSYHY